jgi:ribosomal protein L20
LFIKQQYHACIIAPSFVLKVGRKFMTSSVQSSGSLNNIFDLARANQQMVDQLNKLGKIEAGQKVSVDSQGVLVTEWGSTSVRPLQAASRAVSYYWAGNDTSHDAVIDALNAQADRIQLLANGLQFVSELKQAAQISPEASSNEARLLNAALPIDQELAKLHSGLTQAKRGIKALQGTYNEEADTFKQSLDKDESAEQISQANRKLDSRINEYCLFTQRLQQVHNRYEDLAKSVYLKMLVEQNVSFDDAALAAASTQGGAADSRPASPGQVDPE